MELRSSAAKQSSKKSNKRRRLNATTHSLGSHYKFPIPPHCHIATQQGEKEEREICSLHFPKILFVPRQVFHHSFSLLHLICLGTRNQGGKLKENVWKVLENYILSFYFSFFFSFFGFPCFSFLCSEIQMDSKHFETLYLGFLS